jgi:hypothetical protein
VQINHVDRDVVDEKTGGKGEFKILMKTLIATLAFVTACSSNPLDPGAGDTAGTGTKTLSIDGGANAHPTTPNAADAAGFKTDFEIDIKLGTSEITTGTVTVTSSSGKTALAFDMTTTNHWLGTAAGYDEVYQLDVDDGTDTVSGVRVDGPGIHTITTPSASASIDSTMMTSVTWARDEAAQTAVLHIDDNNGGNGDLPVSDTGNFSIPANTFKAQKDQTRPATVSLTRTNQIAPAGAAAGSTFTVGVENEVDVIVLANPAAAN